ncbi:excise protein [Mycobacterium phage Kinbote]|uniref:Excise protein n=3 Tax=Gilesvirus giles TaxID=1982151 RepID=A0A0H4U2N3_9CAUD|nr:excise protein [Mycobacterium phage Kinbote]ATN90416.1 excise protein [Mycobacterium phage LilHazelnut]QBQ71232.1 excise [Mycobacterium phage Daegal]
MPGRDRCTVASGHVRASAYADCVTAAIIIPTMDTTQPDALLLSIPEARAMLGGIGRTTLYELIGRGDIKKVKIGARGFITRASIVAYVERLSSAQAS